MRDGYLQTGELLLPADKLDPSAWACVACDQYTSQPEYWRQANTLVGDAPSALRLILPEADLGQAAARVPEIHSAMLDYLESGELQVGVADGLILTERTTESGARTGLVMLLDLEGYDYQAGSVSAARATEGTILDRIPPRLAIRRGAALELSHVMMLIDDPAHTVMEPLAARRDTLELLYDFPLMMGGGHLRGYAITAPEDLAGVFSALKALREKAEGTLLYAVGDGNHSLAAAKAYWEEVKPTLAASEQANHPARFAMVELVNIHDEALVFGPIHRVLYGFDGDALLPELGAFAQAHGWELAASEEGQRIVIVYEGKEVAVSVTGSGHPLAVGTLQAFLDAWIPAHPGTRLDYVHGESAARELSQQPNTIAFLLPALHKAELFPAVEKLGALPRKTFSMGHANEKRFYMEARKLR